MLRLSALVTITLVGLVAGNSASRAQDQLRMEGIPKPNVTEQIVGGVPALPQSWPATLLFTSKTGLCTSTVVGEKVLLTAAHCVDNGAKALVTFGSKAREVQCVHHPKYRGPDCSLAKTAEAIAGCTADIALCFPIDNGSFPVDSAKFERVSTTMPGPKAGDIVKLLGWGCTQKGGPVSGALLTSQPDPAVEYGSTPGAANKDKSKSLLEYIKAKGSSAVCSGDSGGAIYSKAGDGRELLGVVSRGNMSTDSYITSLLDPDIQAFLKDQTIDRKRPVCGRDPSAVNCRP